MAHVLVCLPRSDPDRVCSSYPEIELFTLARAPAACLETCDCWSQAEWGVINLISTSSGTSTEVDLPTLALFLVSWTCSASSARTVHIHLTAKSLVSSTKVSAYEHRGVRDSRGLHQASIDVVDGSSGLLSHLSYKAMLAGKQGLGYVFIYSQTCVWTWLVAF